MESVSEMGITIRYIWSCLSSTDEITIVSSRVPRIGELVDINMEVDGKRITKMGRVSNLTWQINNDGQRVVIWLS